MKYWLCHIHLALQSFKQGQRREYVYGTFKSFVNVVYAGAENLAMRGINKFLVVLIWSGISWCNLQAQSSTAESLKRQLITAQPDTHRVNLLIDLAWEINEIQTEEAAIHLQEAVSLAQKLKFIKGEAMAWNGLGVVEEIRGNYTVAYQYYQKALGLRRQTGDLAEIASSLNNIGVLLETTGHFDSAIVYHRRNLEIQENLGDTVRMARAHFNIAGACLEMGEYLKAQESLNEARAILEVQNDQDGLAKVTTQLGHIQLELDRYEDARKFYHQALRIRQKGDDPVRLADALTDYANALDELENTDSTKAAIGYYTRALDIWKQLNDLQGQANVFNNLGDAHKHLGNYQLAFNYLRQAEKICLNTGDAQGLMESYNTMGDVYSRAGQQEKSLELIRKYYKIAVEINDAKFIQSAYKDFSEVYAKMGDYTKAYDYRVKYDELRYERLSNRFINSFIRNERLFSDEKKQRQIEQQKNDLKLKEAQLATARNRQYAYWGGGIALCLLIGLLFNRNRMRARRNRELAAKNEQIEQERQRSDELLLNILPAATAAELKTKAAVKPVRYESVTVMFTDFKSFTKIAESVSPEELIEELDDCFRLFDVVVSEFGLEKIKTIGDSYMCAGGLPVANETHPADVVRAAIQMQCRLQALMRQNGATGKPVFEMRIGIHTGPVVAGVVGSHKFAYDIWGDTVNTASRLEQGSESGKINISETTHRLVKDIFPCTYRGRLAAKNKGEIDMYFVEYECAGF